jgi:hypothetical protein
MTTTGLDWSNVEAAAKQLAGNWRNFDSFAWSRGSDLEDRDRWCIWYTSHRDARLLEQSNETAITDRLRPFSEGDDPDLVFESHSHWAVGYLKGFSVRVYRDGSITAAFKEFCRIKEALDDYPILDDEDYTAREYEATLENYCNEMWRQRDVAATKRTARRLGGRGLLLVQRPRPRSFHREQGRPRGLGTARADHRGPARPGLLPTAVVDG